MDTNLVNYINIMSNKMNQSSDVLEKGKYFYLTVLKIHDITDII